MTKMNPDVKAKWLSALRSGEYKKTEGALAKKNEDGELCFCALGVLCDLHLHGTDGEWTMPDRVLGERAPTYLGKDDLLPKDVKNWAGLDNENPVIFKSHDPDIDDMRVSEMNDGDFDEPKSFAKIADLIEKNL